MSKSRQRLGRREREALRFLFEVSKGIKVGLIRSNLKAPAMVMGNYAKVELAMAYSGFVPTRKVRADTSPMIPTSRSRRAGKKANPFNDGLMHDDNSSVRVRRPNKKVPKLKSHQGASRTKRAVLLDPMSKKFAAIAAKYV